MTTAGPPPTRSSSSSTALVVVVALVVGLLLVAALGAAAFWFRGGGAGALLPMRGSGVTATEQRDVPRFTEIELAGSASVTVRAGEQQSVRVVADDNLVSRVTTRVRSGTLVIDTRGSMWPRSRVEVDVTVPELEAVRLAGSGTVEISDLQASDLTVELPGSGRVTASGSVDSLRAELAGSGRMQLGDLRARDVTAEVSGSGTMDVQATRSLEARVSGSGSIRYSGDPVEVDREVSGSGSITPR